MKKTIRAVVLGIALSAVLLAQGQFGPRASGGTPPDPATRIANQVTRLTTLLDLTTAQSTQITSILTAEQSAVSALQTTLNTDYTSLKTAISGNATGTIDQLSAAIGTLNGQSLAIRSKAEAAIYALLTAPQQAKLATVDGFGGLLGGPGGPGGPGGGRGFRP
jgi:Spy/CpxP family protein refolding chaperone